MRASVVAYLLLVCTTAVEGFTAVSRNGWNRLAATRRLHHVAADDNNANVDHGTHHREHRSGAAAVAFSDEKLLWLVAAPAALALCTATPAEAADVVPSALWAYGHYLSMLVAMGSLVAERVLIKPQMSTEEEEALRLADLVYVVSLVTLLITGGLRATEFGKGFDFYSHEILFWLKMSFAGVLLGCSIFPSITLYRRGNNAAPPMSEKLAKRMTAVVNAEISGLVTIPLLAAFMARGVTYANEFPWPAGLVLAVIASGGACYYYGKQAVSWEEAQEAAKDDA